MLHEPLTCLAGATASPIDRTGGVPVETCGLRIESGAASLYLDWPGRAGRRRYLAGLGAGEIILPITSVSGSGSARLLVFPTTTLARLTTFSLDVFLAGLDTGETSTTAEAEAWIERTLRIAGNPLSGPNEAAGHLDLGRMARPASIGSSTSAVLATPGTLARAVREHQDWFARALLLAEAQRETSESAVIKGKAARDRIIVATTLEPLVVPSASEAPRGTSLEAIFRVVAKATAVALPRSPPPPEAREADAGHPERQLVVLADWAGVRFRRVRLRQIWWRRSGQPMLGFRKDGTPVALIAGTGWRGGYHLRAEGLSRPVRIREATNLAGYAYVLQRRLPDAPIDGRGLLRFAAPLAWPALVAILMIGLAGSLLGLVTPLATEILFETVIPAASRPELVQLAAGIAALSLGGIVFELVRNFLLLRLATLLNTDLEGAVWDRLLRLPTSFFRGYSAGDLALRASAINQMRDTVGGTVIGSLLSAVFAVSSLALILYYEWRLALVAIGLVIIQIGVMVAINLRLLTWKRQALETEGRLHALALQLIQGIAKLKVAGAEARGFARWAPLFIERRALDLRQSGVSAGFSAFETAFGTAATALMIGLVGLGDIEISIGRFVAFNAAYGQLMSATLSLGSALPALLSLRPLYGRAAPLLAAVPESIGSRGGEHELRGGIEIKDVMFRYRADGPAILGGVSMHVHPGEFIGIVGASGSGKSTLMRILLGFETPASGSVFFDNQEMRSLDLRSIRRQIGVVLQSSRAIGGTIIENILNGASLTEADAWEAARLAGLDEDIRAMPMRMHTFVGDDSTLLSGGQRQRLLIARALVRRPRILLFDEATSALDTRTQQIVSERLERLDVTRVVIAHRLSTIQKADRIYAFEAGKIVDQGTYQELIARGGIVTHLAHRQTA